jgi:hypothetical protein
MATELSWLLEICRAVRKTLAGTLSALAAKRGPLAVPLQLKPAPRPLQVERLAGVEPRQGAKAAVRRLPASEGRPTR